MRRSTTALAVIAAGAGLVLSPTGAAAQTTHVDDPQGDSTSPAVDITKVRVHHGRNRIKVVATIPRLDPGRLSGTELLIRPRGRAKVYAVSVLRDRQGEVAETSLSWRPLNDPVEPRRLPCSGIRTALRGDRVVVSVAKSCLTRAPQALPVRAKVRTVDGTTGLDGHYWDDQSRITGLLREGRTSAGGTTGPEGRVNADGGLVVRALPTTRSPRQGRLRDGALVPIDCRVTGSVVRRDDDQDGQASNLWYRLTGGGPAFVSALHVRSTGSRVPSCGDGRTYRGRVTAGLLVPREAPTTRANAHGGFFRGRTVRIGCKLHGQDVRGNDLWYHLPQGLWVSARYVANIGPAPAFCVG